MATIITSECINCGACEPECPNTAIYQGGVEWELNGAKSAAIADEIFYIVPEKCTECVGFYDHEACAAVCPVDCCVPNPDIPETEGVLIERAKQLHPDQTFEGDFPSRFKKDGGAPAAAPPAAAPAPSSAPQAAPEVKAAAAPPPAPEPKAAPAASTAPAAAPAAAKVAAAVAPAAESASSLAIPDIDDWEIPIECFRCHGTYAVAFHHVRSGVVFYCPYCNGSFVVNLSLHRQVSESLHRFHDQWRKDFESFQEKRQRELVEFEERQRQALESFNQSLKGLSHEVRPPGAPRKRAWIFG